MDDRISVREEYVKAAISCNPDPTTKTVTDGEWMNWAWEEIRQLRGELGRVRADLVYERSVNRNIR